MENFMSYLEITASMVNQCFNTVTREGQDQIFFEDVVEVIGFLEEAKLLKQQEESQNEIKLGIMLNKFELEFLIKNFGKLKEIKTVKNFEAEIKKLKKKDDMNFNNDIVNQNKNFLPLKTMQDLFNLFINSSDELFTSLLIKLENKKRELGNKKNLNNFSFKSSEGIKKIYKRREFFISFRKNLYLKNVLFIYVN